MIFYQMLPDLRIIGHPTHARNKRRSVSTDLCTLTLLLVFFSAPILCFAQSAADASREKCAALFRQGLDLAVHGRLAEAEESLQQAQTLSPNNTDVLTNLAKVKARLGELPAAAQLFRKVATLHPHSGEAHLDLAIVLADQQDLPAALQEVTQAVQLAPKSGPAHLNLARILFDMNKVQEAEAEFVIAAKLQPSNPDSFYYWALLERKTGNYAREASVLQSLAKLKPRNDEAYVLLGHALDYLSKRSEAIAAYRRAIAINPDSQDAVYSLSRDLRTSDPSQSKDLDTHFLSIQEKAKKLDQVKTLGNQAYVAMNKKNWPLAISTLHEALAMCGECEASGNLHKDLGLALCQNGEIPAGRVELQTALRLSPNDPDIIKALSLIPNH